MPPREPRGLFLHREYWSDAEFQTSLTPADREFYLGLCQLADDAGWLDWNLQNVAGYLNRFQQRAPAALNDSVSALKDTKRLRIYACGHAQLLKWGARRHIGRPDATSFAVRDAHSIERRKLPGNKGQTSRKRQEDSVTPTLHYTDTTLPNTTQPTGALARVRGGAPTKIGTTSEFQRLVPKDQALPQKNGGLLSGSEKRHD